MMRLFVAIELPESVRVRLAMLAGGIPGARWVPAENMHLTVRFIGEVDEASVHDVDAALQSVEAPAFELTLEGIGHFGPPRAARSLYVGVARNPALAHLRDKIESALVRAGFEPEGRKFSPHITLARLRNARGSRITAFIAGNNLFREGPIAVEGFTLFSSFRGHNGAIHTPERFYPLAPVGAEVETDMPPASPDDGD
ncbi:MAG TPA: RNA 2',3'-cyclic phosphodiesterase [Alphaproteobacteria bacterium]|jgi:2'-5' RNA ligase|nr:RNA 2',3'-cyclic phosphodiesterase [Alphaproteobacteria bacterium]